MRSTLKAHTHTPIFGGCVVKSAIQSANSIANSANSTINFVIVCRMSVLNMFTFLKRPESADGNRSTIAVGQWQIGLVGMGLKCPYVL